MSGEGEADITEDWRREGLIANRIGYARKEEIRNFRHWKTSDQIIPNTQIRLYENQRKFCTNPLARFLPTRLYF